MLNDYITLADYETLETHLGNHLRKCDNYNTDDELFFPIGFLDRLFHFAEEVAALQHLENPEIKATTPGKDFDLWVDDMVATASIFLSDGISDPFEAQLIDVEQIRIDEQRNVIATVDGCDYYVFSAAGEPLKSDNIQDLAIDIETIGTFSDDERPDTLDYLASIFIRAAMSMKMQVSNANAPHLSSTIYNVFREELLPFIPSLLEDLRLITDSQILRLPVTTN